MRSLTSGFAVGDSTKPSDEAGGPPFLQLETNPEGAPFLARFSQEGVD